MIKLIRGLKARKIITIHDVGRILNGIEKFDVKIAISQAVYLDVLKRSNNNIAPIVIDNGINRDAIKFNTDFSFGNEIKIIQVGRLQHDKKGQDILIRAIALLITDYRIVNVKLIIVGAGPSLGYLEQVIKEHGLTQVVSLVGQKDRKWIYDNLKDFDILVQPSIYEGFGLTIVEGMLAKIPCLVSDIDGPIDLIENGEYGFYFKSASAESCAAALNQIITSNKTGLNEKIERAYAHASDIYSSKRMNEKYLKAYLNGCI